MAATAYAQGDVLLIPVPEAESCPRQIAQAPVVLAEGEHTGHRHAFYGGAVMFRDEGLARDIPRDLYVGHVKIAEGGALLEHGPGPGQRGDHDPVAVPAGTFLALRQREYVPQQAAPSHVQWQLHDD